MQENVNTIGQIFTNYQAALHLFEEAVAGGAGEAVPRELAKEVLREAARDVFEPVMAAAAEAAGEVADHVADGHRRRRRAPGGAAARSPARARRRSRCSNLVVAERRRIAATQMRLLKAQVVVLRRGRGPGAPSGGASYRTRLVGANMDLNELEETLAQRRRASSRR